jgi:hypothetical protein
MSKEQDAKNVEAFEHMLRSLAPGMKATLSTEYALAPVAPASGQWYYSAQCRTCNERTPVVSDPSQGRLGDVFSGPGAIRVQCQACGNWIRAGAQDLESARWP